MNYTKKCLHEVFSDDAIILYAYEAMGSDVKRLQNGESGEPAEIRGKKKLEEFFEKYKTSKPKTYSKQSELDFLRKMNAHYKKHPEWDRMNDRKHLTETEQYALLSIGRYVGLGRDAEKDLKYIHGG